MFLCICLNASVYNNFSILSPQNLNMDWGIYLFGYELYDKYYLYEMMEEYYGKLQR